MLDIEHHTLVNLASAAEQAIQAPAPVQRASNYQIELVLCLWRLSVLGVKIGSKATERGLTVAGSTSTLTLPSSCPKALLPVADCSHAACHLEATKSGTCQYSILNTLLNRCFVMHGLLMLLPITF